MQVIVTGASRGIGRALVLALPPSADVVALARDGGALASLAAARPRTSTRTVDLSSRADAVRVGRALATDLADLASDEPITLVHNAGLWPSERVLAGGLERAFVVNCVAPLDFQRPLLAHPRLTRILVIGAGLMVKGRFDAARTPTGDDFSWFRTYASTKLAFAVAARDLARERPDLDVAVVHPGVVRTELGARPGLLGWLTDRIKRRWESPDACAERLARLAACERWSEPGEAQWFVEESREPWPAVVSEAAPDVRRALAAANAS